MEVDAIKHSIRFDTTTYNRMYAIGPNGPIYNPSFVETSNNLQEVGGNLARAINKTNTERDAIWKMLGDDTAAIARQIEGKYHIKLSKPREQLTPLTSLACHAARGAGHSEIAPPEMRPFGAGSERPSCAELPKTGTPAPSRFPFAGEPIDAPFSSLTAPIFGR